MCTPQRGCVNERRLSSPRRSKCWGFVQATRDIPFPKRTPGEVMEGRKSIVPSPPPLPNEGESMHRLKTMWRQRMGVDSAA